jgi:hypothetical protein
MRLREFQEQPMTSRKKPGVAFWATVALVVVIVGYPLSFGPACWISSHFANDESAFVSAAYRPIFWLYVHGHRQCASAIDRIAGFGASPGWEMGHDMLDDVGVWSDWSSDRIGKVPVIDPVR